MNELRLIEKIRRLSGSSLIGDDCAVLRPKAGRDLLVTTDLCVENVHFRRETHTGFDAGWKCLARGLSDIAAMGGAPRWCFVSLALAPWTTAKYVRDFYRGLLRLAEEHKVTLSGGDVTRAAVLACDIVVIGEVAAGKALTRSGAQPGDNIYVSGLLGRAAANKYRERAEPRVALGRRLLGKATACMDLSDGLAMDLHRLCVESGVAAELDAPVPVFPGATLEQALSGGEDYELLFTSPHVLPFARIGRIVAGKAGFVRLSGKRLRPRGWDPIG